MRILLTNDDGIFAPGIQALCKELEKEHEVLVVAPDRERSATGHAITIHHPLRAKEMKFEEIESKCIAVDGTPADCVKIAVESLLEEEVDLLVSGINAGPNLAHDVLYSGTVSAAIEGLMVGIPSVAVSLATYDEWDFSPGAQFMKGFVKKYSQHELDRNILLNINLPAKSDAEVKITKLGDHGYHNTFEKRFDPRGERYYWLVGEIEEGTDQESDLVTVNDDYISITPLRVDLTANDKLEELRTWDL
ncbi:5'/3'-nucleotidase SurE [Halobacteroides halobius DSM 5150]|uniref:5'-nucleotidase SurE n=1 Tax=Halobacteroides halobius (strain ATCC 35273 / DSM 5150 / MD-1) TaxID=748449 RepID=L0K8N1_HALHC|nr:5'/3'-nucleotidase SurE [Halobacteroides halobius]AGB40719.1 5'/3'-nucleotidase SurE [Halobacteroides halobius DSM 5150]